MLDEAGACPVLVDHERRRREMRADLPARKRLLELLGEPQHRAAVGLLPFVGRDELAKRRSEVTHTAAPGER